MTLGIYWCDSCHHPVKIAKATSCPICGEKTRYLTTDVRPVFARERRILQFYGHGPLTTDNVWRSSKSRFYYINGQSISLPGTAQLKNDLPAIAEYIRDSNHYDSLDKRLIQAYQRQIEVNRAHLLALEDEAFQFIQQAVNRFPRRTLMVSLYSMIKFLMTNFT